MWLGPASLEHAGPSRSDCRTASSAARRAFLDELVGHGIGFCYVVDPRRRRAHARNPQAARPRPATHRHRGLRPPEDRAHHRSRPRRPAQALLARRPRRAGDGVERACARLGVNPLRWAREKCCTERLANRRGSLPLRLPLSETARPGTH